MGTKLKSLGGLLSDSAQLRLIVGRLGFDPALRGQILATFGLFDLDKFGSDLAIAHSGPSRLRYGCQTKRPPAPSYQLLPVDGNKIWA